MAAARMTSSSSSRPGGRSPEATASPPPTIAAAATRGRRDREDEVRQQRRPQPRSLRAEHGGRLGDAEAGQRGGDDRRHGDEGERPPARRTELAGDRHDGREQAGVARDLRPEQGRRAARPPPPAGRPPQRAACRLPAKAISSMRTRGASLWIASSCAAVRRERLPAARRRTPPARPARGRRPRGRPARRTSAPATRVR